MREKFNLLREGRNMEKWDDLKPDMRFLKNRLETFRLRIARGQDTDPSDPRLKRLEYELTLLSFQTQVRLIETIEKSIVSQDKFSKNANFLAFSALILVAVDIIFTIFIR
jgi:hypothetical protein